MPKIYQGITVCEIALFTETESRHKFVLILFSEAPFICSESSITQITQRQLLMTKRKQKSKGKAFRFPLSSSSVTLEMY